ncbi:MAG: HlyD family type I secretion periplasmic adaptor subunit [Parvularculaceae bacterium]|nr:HlyD family type I secretion periplasmic adaptor subunit [Parvularculaceae bacterium]
MKAQKASAGTSRVTDRGSAEIRAGGAVLFAFFGLFLGWAALAPLDAAVVAPGVVVVSGNRQAVEHRDGGIVGRLAVKEGQVVKQGDVLIELSSPEVVARERALLSQIVDLKMQRARLAAEAEGADELAMPADWMSWPPADKAIAESAFERHKREAAMLGTRGAWSEYEARIVGYRDEMAAVSRQEALVRQDLQAIRKLEANEFAPKMRVRELERRIAELQARHAELRSEIAATQQARAERMRAIDARLAEIEPQFIAARAQMDNMLIRAPADGAVVGLKVFTEGAVVKPGERVMEIVPEGRELVVEAQVRPEDADNLEIGQQAEIRITAFKGRNAPPLAGSVIRVSADRLTDERSGVGYFAAQVRVSAEELDRAVRSGGGQLRAGLPAEAVIKTRKRTALQFLLEPLNQSLWRSFREE